MPQSQARLAPAQYAFAPAQKHITFAGVPGFTIDGLVLVVNAASGKVILDPQDSSGALGGTASGSIVTPGLRYHGDVASDPLRIIYRHGDRVPAWVVSVLADQGQTDHGPASDRAALMTTPRHVANRFLGILAGVAIMLVLASLIASLYA